MKLAIVGTRTFDDYELMCECLKNGVFTTIVSGGSQGADKLAERYAQEHDINMKVFPADWKQYGPSAGPRRNTQIVEYCDALLAFWDGKSTGTQDSIKKATAAGKPVKVVRY